MISTVLHFKGATFQWFGIKHDHQVELITFNRNQYTISLQDVTPAGRGEHVVEFSDLPVLTLEALKKAIDAAIQYKEANP